ncbi:DgyrCDS5216 [Dimorphilus gyrociliatus]|uniref:DNA polymerase delta subunit 3 n=1 Tax=Dimorphilus gyrociliatus TaxID=2664684 RepID=A0A7I8VJV0_9ANNE|nr:DgyrCDS5216 [Dimorphilus gyrociliatus]
MKRFASKYLEILNELIDDKDEIVTYKKLSCIGNIPVNHAKEVLGEYASKREDLEVIYTLIGSVEQNRKKVTKIQFCKEPCLEDVKQNYSNISSCHVYSVSKTKILGYTMLYSNEKIEQNNMKVCLEGDNKGTEAVMSAILCETGSRCENKPLKKEVVTEKRKEVVKSEQEKKTTNENNDKEKLTTAKPKETKATSAKLAKAETKTTEKRKGSSDFFKATTNPKKTTQLNKKDERTAQIEDHSSDDIVPNKTKQNSFQSSKSSAQDKEEIGKKHNIKEEKKKENARGSRKKSKGESDSSINKRRKRIAIETSSEEEEESKPAQSVEDSTQASITELSQPVDVKRRKRIRKQVTKTFVNDEGYMVTEKVYESASTDASEDELKKPESKKPVETSKPKKRVGIDCVGDILFTVRDEPSSTHLIRYKNFKEHLIDQDIASDSVVSFSELLTEERAFLIIPVLNEISKKVKYSKAKWVVVCTEDTRFITQELSLKLAKYNEKKAIYFGLGLKDQEVTIIHHFDTPGKLIYPLLSSGIIFSMSLVKTLGKDYSNWLKKVDDFTIDVQYELAKYIYNEGKGPKLKSVNWLCTKYVSACASYFSTIKADCGGETSDNHFFIGIKTCHLFHKDRIPVILDTWYKDIRNSKSVRFFSDQEDSTVPNLILNKAPNTESGHCSKCFEIFQTFFELPDSRDWLVVTDDDTLINIAELRKILSCYDPNEAIAIGEKYGFGLAKDYGYSYITGGGGMIFSKQAVKLIMECQDCRCPSHSSPDDMLIGLWLSRISAKVVHSPLFHQARPIDYAAIFINSQIPISFHKHWMIDPRDAYEKYLASNPKKQRDEL